MPNLDCANFNTVQAAVVQTLDNAIQRITEQGNQLHYPLDRDLSGGFWTTGCRLPKQNTRATNENISTELFNKDWSWIILSDVVFPIWAKFRHDFTSSNPAKHKARMSESFDNSFCLINLFCKSEFSLTTSLRFKCELHAKGMIK